MDTAVIINKNNQKLKEGDLVAPAQNLHIPFTDGRIPKTGVVTKVFHEDVFGDFYYRVHWQMPYSLITTEPENSLEKKA
jgi:hypothetical protein